MKRWMHKFALGRSNDSQTRVHEELQWMTEVQAQAPVLLDAARDVNGATSSLDLDTVDMNAGGTEEGGRLGGPIAIPNTTDASAFPFWLAADDFTTIPTETANPDDVGTNADGAPIE